MVSLEQSVRRVEDVAGLAVLFEEGVNVVVLARAAPAPVLREFRVLGERPGFKLLVALAPGSGAAAQLEAQLPGLPNLARDIASWAQVLADLTGCPQVGVRLARVDAAMCPRFHVDRVLVRLVSTYLGEGTEYLCDTAVDRALLGAEPRAGAAVDASPVREGHAPLRAGAGELVLLKGEAWPGNAGRGAVHRSPHCAAASPRVVLTLDPLAA